MQGYIDTLLEGALSDPQVNYAFLKKASKSVDRLIELVDDLTSISRIESGEMKMEMKKFDIRKLVEQVFDDVKDIHKSTELTFSFRQSADVVFKVVADKKESNRCWLIW